MTWTPHGTRSHYGRPPVGALIAVQHGVWRITNVTDAALSDADADMWRDLGCPDPWKNRPHDIALDHVGGHLPDGIDAKEGAWLSIPGSAGARRWDLYPDSERWPQCSCCGEPMPCRAELQDREVAAGLNRIEALAKIPPGHCWACTKPITRRQKAVVYAGDNLDLPGAEPARFHVRSDCRWKAEQYERRWIAQDPRRERIFTYPKCGGILVVHADGSSECRSGRGALGNDYETQAGCRGHLTHDHGMHTACYVGDEWFARPSEFPGCPRGCSQDNHPGTRTSRRPAVRNQQALL